MGPSAEKEQAYKKEKSYYEQEYEISRFKELPFCIIVPTYQNIKNHKYYFNLHSILMQEYSHFRTVIIDDASTDGTAQAIAY